MTPTTEAGRRPGHYAIGPRDGGSEWHIGTAIHRECRECAGVTVRDAGGDVERLAVAAAARLEGEVSRLRTELDACTEAYAALVPTREQVEQAYIDGSVAGSPVDLDGNRAAPPPPRIDPEGMA